MNCLTTGTYIDGFIDEGGSSTGISLSKLIAVSTASPPTQLSNTAEPSASSRKALQHYVKPLAIALMFILWIIPAPIVNRIDLKVFGIPLLWLYYLVLSIAISITLTLLYFKLKGGNSG